MKEVKYNKLFEKYLAGKSSCIEISQLKSWIRNDKNISDWMEQKFLNSSSQMNSLQQDAILEKIHIEANIKIKNRNITLRPILRFAATILIPIFCIFMTYYLTKPEYSETPFTVSVAKGQKANISLPDGTRVWLNSQSQISYNTDYNLNERRVKLEGEAYFEVARNVEQPFIVEGSEISVMALGTSFSVKTYESDTKVSALLMTGKIKVTLPTGEMILKPNDRLEYDRKTNSISLIQTVNALAFTGWIRDELRFENESLIEITKVIQRIYNVEIHFANEAMKYQRFTGTIPDNGLESIFDMISLTSAINYKTSGQKIILYEKTPLNTR